MRDVEGGGWLGTIVVPRVAMLLVLCATPSAAQRWTAESRVDAMTDQRIVWADLPATTLVRSSWRSFRPFIETICFPKDSSVLFRLYGSVPAKVESTDPDEGTYATIRFDREHARPVRFTLSDGGQSTYVMELDKLAPRDSSADREIWRWDYWVQVRDEFFNDLLNAHRLLIQYTLLSGDTPTVEFQLGQSTRAAVERVFNACHRVAPGREFRGPH